MVTKTSADTTCSVYRAMSNLKLDKQAQANVISDYALVAFPVQYNQAEETTRHHIIEATLNLVGGIKDNILGS